MRPVLVFLLLASALVVLARVGAGIMIGLANGRPSPVLIGVFALDSLAIVVIAWHLVMSQGRASR